MPRKRKTLSGADAQNIGSVPGQRYGEGIEQQSIQQAMPAPQARQPLPTPEPGGRPGPTPQPVTPPPTADPALIQDFLASHNPNLLATTQRPDEPLTEGLPFGPGRGPSAVQANRTPIARFLNNLANETGNQKWKRLAAKAGLQ